MSICIKLEFLTFINSDKRRYTFEYNLCCLRLFATSRKFSILINILYELLITQITKEEKQITKIYIVIKIILKNSLKITLPVHLIRIESIPFKKINS